MIFKGAGDWIKEKLKALRGKGKEPGAGDWIKEKLKALRGKGKEPGAKPQQRPSMRRFRFKKPPWFRNMLHPTAHSIARGRTLNPAAVARAKQWHERRLHELGTKIQAGKASPKEQREWRRINGQ